MCNPILFVAAGAAVSAIGKLSEGASAKAAAYANANAADAQSLDSLNRGATEEARYRREISQLIGTQRAVTGARNVTQSGTAMDILEDTTALGEMDAQTIRGNTQREYRGLRSQAKELRRQGRAAQTNSYFSAAGTLLTGGGNAYSMYKAGQ